jgi:hypothetical protein
MEVPMSDLSPETLALLDRARDDDAMPASHRSAVRRRLAIAVGIAAPMAMGTTAAASVSVATWAVRGLAILGAAGVVSAAALAPSPAVAPSGRDAVVVAPVTRPQVGVAARLARPSTPEVPTPSATDDAVVPDDDRIPDGAAPAAVEPVPRAPLRPAARVEPIARVEPTAGVESTARVEPAEDSLATEVRLVSDARAAIDSGDPSRALVLLADHDRRFAVGALAPEVYALRIDALCAAGRTTDAEAEARRFEAHYSGSPLERRFASTCARAAAPAPATMR